MKDDIVYKKLTSQREIEMAMSLCASDFFDQSFNNPKTIKLLSKKYAEYAEFIVVKHKNQIVGFIAFYDNDKINRCGFLSMIIVSKQFQGSGIGSALLRMCIEQCKKNKMTNLCLEVNEENRKAFNWYEKVGFKEERRNDKSIFLKKIVA